MGRQCTDVYGPQREHSYELEGLRGHANEQHEKGQSLELILSLVMIRASSTFAMPRFVLVWMSNGVIG